MTIKNVAIYLRKSRKEDNLTDAEALENHREVLTSLATANEWNYDVYYEVASSMDTDNRPELQRLLRSISNFNAVLVMDIDRLSRNRYDSAKIMEVFKSTDTKIVTADGSITDLNNEHDEIMTGMQEVFANYEYNQIKKRMMRGKKAAAKKGLWATGRVPLGYIYNRQSKRLQVNPEEAEIVGDIFWFYGQDKWSAEKISTELNRQGKRGKNGKLFVPSNVLRILRNDVYRGHTTMMGEKVLNTHKAIIKDDLWHSVQARATIHSGKGSRVSHGLSGILKCGYCGKTLAINIQPTNGVRMVKGCHRRDILTGELCRNRGLVYSEAFHFIKEELKVFRENMHHELSSLLQREGELGRAANRELESVKNLISKCDISVERLNRAYMNGDLTDDEFSALKGEKLTEKQHLEDRLQKLQASKGRTLVDEVTECISVLDELLEGDTEYIKEKELNELLKRVISEAYLYNLPNEETRLHIKWRNSTIKQ